MANWCNWKQVYCDCSTKYGVCSLTACNRQFGYTTDNHTGAMYFKEIKPSVPIEWIWQWCNRSENTYSKADVIEMLNDWERENEVN